MGSCVFVCKRLVKYGFGLSSILNQVGCDLRLNFKSSMLVDKKWMSSETVNKSKSSDIVAFLENKFGLSNKSALSASKYLQPSISPEKVDSLISLFKGIGLTKSQINGMIRRYPALICLTEQNIRPKIEFFQSKGIMHDNLVKVLTRDPAVLGRSLTNQLIPCFDYLMSVLCSVEKVNLAISHAPDILRCDAQSEIGPNLAFLRECGVPESNIQRLLYQQPRSMYWSPEKFKTAVDDVKEMGVSPLQSNFVFVVQVKKLVDRSDWEAKKNNLKKWGWSDEDFMFALIRNPWFMVHSEDKINAVMDILIDKMGLENRHIIKRPLLLSLSLKKRIIPRFFAFRVLSSKGLIHKCSSLTVFLERSDKLFLCRYVMPFEKEAPLLMKSYAELVANPPCSGYTIDWRAIDLEVGVEDPATSLKV